MNGYVINIEKAAGDNENFRKVLYTAKNSQLVLMSLKPGEEIGEEVKSSQEEEYVLRVLLVSWKIPGQP